MSLFGYEMSRRVARHGLPFYALIMAAMRQADTANAAKLQQAWPEVWAELDARYNAPATLASLAYVNNTERSD